MLNFPAKGKFSTCSREKLPKQNKCVKFGGVFFSIHRISSAWEIFVQAKKCEKIFKKIKMVSKM